MEGISGASATGSVDSFAGANRRTVVNAHSSEIVLAAPRQMRTVLADGGWLGHSGVVRTRVTKKAWFGPKRLIGWGWSIASWEGRLVTAVVLGLALAAHFVWHSIVAVVALLILYGVVILLTGDPPGRPGRRD